jgi:hypothetical protein
MISLSLVPLGALCVLDLSLLLEQQNERSAKPEKTKHAIEKTIAVAASSQEVWNALTTPRN